ncbi:MAG: hypothetical protein NPINA01_04180 [Nitrospinaceae bacterium]|nr:MAG: hypothetical protein NPINA01_04180 [Nitrospinaceae bacterium]
MMNFSKIKTGCFAMISRVGVFLLIWWILTDGAPSSWWIGVPAVLLAGIVSAALIPPVPIVWLELLKFVPFFLLHSLLGGVDVARRAFQPNLPIAPGLIEYPFQLPQGLPLVFMTTIVNLLPGTLIAEFDQSLLKVHVLDRRKDFMTELEAVEQRVARIFGTSLQISEGG